MSEKIKVQRERSNITQTELGEMLGVTQRSVSAWERNISKPTVDNLLTLSKIFNVPITYWFSEEEQPKRDNVTDLIEKLVNNKIITDPDHIPESVSKMIIDAVRMDLRMKQLEK